MCIRDSTITLPAARASHADASPLRVYNVGEPVVPCLLYTSDKLKDDFNSLRNMFDELKREIDKNVVREENYKGEFYEISPYSCLLYTSMESLTCGKVNTPTDAFLPTITTHQQETSSNFTTSVGAKSVYSMI